MPVTSEQFRSALSRFASGVTVVTTKDTGGRFHGITVSSFCSVSLSPPMVLICIERTTGSHNAFRESGVFVVNVLSSEQRHLSERFASPHDDKFDGVEFSLGVDGVPVIDGCLAVLECRVRHAFEGGDHSIFVGEVEAVESHNGEPLAYFRSSYRWLGNGSPARGQAEGT